MGLLDDAIREHLDLKRRTGADPAEVERLEREALGPVKRAAYEPEEPALDPDYAQQASAAPAIEPDQPEPALGAPVFDQAPEYEPAPLAESEPAAELPRHHEIAEAWEEHESLEVGESVVPQEPVRSEVPFASEEPFDDDGPSVSEEPFVVEERLAPGEPDRTDVLPPPRDHLAEETAEYDVEAEHAAEREPAEEGEDVLEETPDFLQDTPDHDRLWFEQRPPRDFDFDG